MRAIRVLLLSIVLVACGKPADNAPRANRTAVRESTLRTARELSSRGEYGPALKMLDRLDWLRADPEAKALRDQIAAEELSTRPEREAAAAERRRQEEAAAARRQQEETARAAAQQKKQAIADATALLNARRAYAPLLREKFLDQGLDIKVYVSGKNSDQLFLSYVLFNDVWTHKFEKGDLVKQIRNLGFTRIDFNNQYDYHVYYNLK
jgi:hypothetical protein